MPDRDLALWYARRLRDAHDLPFPATLDALLAVCRRLGIAVAHEPGFGKPGWFAAEPDPTIILQRLDPWLLAHELLHPWVLERDPERGRCEEAVCNRFASLLCVPTAQHRALLEIPDELLEQAEVICPGKYQQALANSAASSAVIYCWAARQPGEGGRRSTNEQERWCEAQAERDGLRLARVFRDYGNPLRGDARPQGKALLIQAGALQEQGVGAIYVVHESRFAPVESLRRPMLDTLEGMGLEVRSLDLPQWRLAWR